MQKFDRHSIDRVIKEKENDLHQFCSPFSGNCYEIALSLYRIFPKQAEGFWSVYAEKEFVRSSDTLPLHVVVQIRGELFDAAGHLHQSDLLREYAPKQDRKLLRFDEEFQYENIVTDDILKRTIEIYESALENVCK